MQYKFTTIAVKDLDKSVDFYTEVIKLSQERRFSPREGVEIAFMADENGNEVELLSNQAISANLPDTPSRVTLGFDVEDLDETLTFLRQRGIEIKRGPVEIPGGRFLTIEDPDGVQIGIHEDN